MDQAAVRCPAVSAADRAEADRYVAAPQPDTTDANGRPVVSDAAKRAKFDEFRVAVARKNKVIKRSHADQDACRGSTPTTS